MGRFTEICHDDCQLLILKYIKCQRQDGYRPHKQLFGVHFLFAVEEGYRTDKEGTSEEDGLIAGQCSARLVC